LYSQVDFVFTLINVATSDKSLMMQPRKQYTRNGMLHDLSSVDTCTMNRIRILR